MFTLYTDAATDTETQLCAAGILIVHAGQQTQLKQALADGDNHHAEFLAAIAGFNALLKTTETQAANSTVLFYTDSKIVADSLDKHYAKHYQPLVDQLLDCQSKFALVISKWVPEKQNQGAHHLAQQALQQHRQGRL